MPSVPQRSHRACAQWSIANLVEDDLAGLASRLFTVSWVELTADEAANTGDANPGAIPDQTSGRSRGQTVFLHCRASLPCGSPFALAIAVWLW